MGKGRKKSGTKSSGNDLKAPAVDPLPQGQSSHSFPQLEEVKLNAFNAEKTNSVCLEAASSADNKNKVHLVGESSSFLPPKKTSSVPCHFFQRGYCRYGDACRFQHTETAAGPTERLNSVVKEAPSVSKKPPSEKTCAPEECLDWHLTGSCPRYRTCRYAHPIDCGAVGSSKNMKSGMHMDVGMAELLLRGLGASRGGCRDDLMEERMMNGGFTEDDIYELSLQGIKPWDPEAMDALAVLKGWDMDYSDDYDDGIYGF